MAVSTPERQVAEQIARSGGVTVAKLGLRFDRVVIRLLRGLARFAEGATPAGTTVLVTVTAPIRSPSKTAAALEREIAALVSGGGGGVDRRATLCGNEVQLRLIEHSSRAAHKLIGLVHNPDVPAARLLDLAAAWLSAVH